MSIFPFGKNFCPACSHMKRLLSSESSSISSSRSVLLTSPIYNLPPQSTATPQAWVPVKQRRKSMAALDLKPKEKVGNNPWSRMIRSPKRMCIVTRQTLPSAFLINLRATYFPPSQGEGESIQLLPNAVATPSCTKKGKGMYVLCQKETIDRLVTGKGPHLSILRQIPHLQIPPNLTSIIHGQLLYRILYELRHIYRRLEALPRCGNRNDVVKVKSVLQWLSEEEIEDVRSGKAVTDKDVVAFIDVAGLTTSASPTTIQDIPLPSSLANILPDVPLLPLKIDSGHPGDRNTNNALPVYKLASLFPSELHSFIGCSLQAVILTERQRFPPNHYLPHQRTPSEVLALRTFETDEHDTVQGGLGTPLAVSLWRLVCFHGQAWEA
ncbi:hypothetical protein C349_04616 [Cryptococcus neoformans var. grubii Br795]|uniref:Uncharacterized protein n=1 Tax=Cryptococcus neoformans Tu259-1 TaxID=1230072 RepID=A0A854Q9A7_CRYNE|nr:hypothetical protein C368_04763 [Cryptococcus neoformans var. grubii 125.91]OXG16535.1 hypothetical protein C361_04904 [Cryptococcus neoformans var. grubii Tu259-1]OXG35854.1 hypothetical protein C360_02454 [Cryptococcus neoformans var. grubii Bt15]OXG77037.1 hypothetical protein C350_04473 [Cryptococcus neoformans var. grubii MW-RSA36]OXG78860.1 hypothetical protein C349_04616 [Cryptococcus neoformans var. grubii Br795]OXG82815.1 hypothetical protein C346_04528 [Cryptococcus neoformans var